MKLRGGNRLFLWIAVIAGLFSVSGWKALCAAETPLVVEKMLSPDSVLAVVVRDAGVTSERWKTTALYEVLQTPEMQQMLAPMRESLLKLTSALPPGLVKSDAGAGAEAPWSALCTGEAAVAVVVLPPHAGGAEAGAEGAHPELMLQVVMKPADAAQGKAAMDALLNGFVQSKAATSASRPDNAQLLSFGEKAVLLYSISDGVIVLTLNDKPIPAFAKLHADTLARLHGTAGLSADPEYALARGKLGPAPEAWVWFGLFPWLERNGATPPISMAKPVLAALGLDRMGGCAAGTTIEDRGFRTRLFVHVTRAAPAPAPQAIVPQQLALVPRDVLAFSIGSADWTGFYDKVMGALSMIPGGTVAQGVSSAEAVLGMSIRNDLLGMLSGPFVMYATEPGSAEGEGQSFFLQLRDRSAATQKLTMFLNSAAGFIRQMTGPDGDGFVRIRTIERPHLAQIYPQSLLPGAVTPNFVISDTGWLGIDLSARSAVAKMDYFMNHPENVTARPDFARVLAKMPPVYTTISYTDVGRCFGNGLAGVQLGSDIVVAALKIAESKGQLKLPMPLDQFWGMDQGRFPSQTLLSEKLFGSVTVTVPDADGVLYENFSPIGPIPLSTGQGGAMESVATTSILAGMLLPALARAREEARKASCASNLAQIMKGIITYQSNHNDNLPPSLADLFPEYMDNPKVLVCPSDSSPMTIKNGLKCSYRYIGNIPWRDVGPGQIVAYDHEDHDDGLNAAYFDGHVQFVPLEQFNKLLADQYESFKKLMAKSDFPGDRERVKAFFENRDFPEK